jgi:hypothetical protein
VETLEELGGHGMVLALMMFFMIIISFIGAVCGSIALYKRAFLTGAVGWIMNVILLIGVLLKISLVYFSE